MTIAFSALLLLFQTTAAVQPPSPRASVAGVVVQTRTGEPIPSVRVTLARTDAKLGAFADLVGGDHPPTEMILPGEFLNLMKDGIANEIAAGGAGGQGAAEAAAISSLPADDIHELIISPTGQVAMVYKSAPPVLTDSRGRFVFDNVEPGTYRVIFSAAGYAKQDYGQRVTGGAGTSINLKPGDAKTDIIMRMSRIGAISGRIQDSQGQPAVGVPLQLFRWVYDENGQRNPLRVASTDTNDRGEYRFFFLSPGRYHVKAGNEGGQDRLPGLQAGLASNPFGIGGYSSPNRISQNYAVAYYPGVPDANAAAAIDLQPGADLSGVDMYLSPQQTYRVRGRVVDPRTGRPPGSANITLMPHTRPDDFMSILMSMSGAANYNAADGSFEIRNVAPGTYSLSVDLPNPQPPQRVDVNSLPPAERTAYMEAQAAADRARPRASIPVNVVNADVDGLSIAIGVTGGISGRIRIDSNSPNAANRSDFLRVTLRQADGAPFALLNAPDFRPPKPDGTFRIESLWPGEYRLAVAGLPQGFYVKEARFGDGEALNAPLRFNGDDSMTLDVVISPNAGKVEGTVADRRGQPAPGVQVVLIPARNIQRTDLFRSVTADANGRFAISSVAPGDYKLVAWDGIEPYAYFDPDLIRQAEQNGAAVRVAESSQQTVNITVF